MLVESGLLRGEQSDERPVHGRGGRRIRRRPRGAFVAMAKASKRPLIATIASYMAARTVPMSTSALPGGLPGAIAS